MGRLNQKVVYKLNLFDESIELTLTLVLDQQEALSTLKVAIELKTLGKDDKALRLFKHALALAPKNPEVLTHYGEYLEHNRRDILSADLMYFQVSFRDCCLK